MARFSHYLFLWATLLSIFFHAPQVIAQNHSMDIEHRAATEIYSVEQLISERTLNPAPTVKVHHHDGDHEQQRYPLGEYSIGRSCHFPGQYVDFSEFELLADIDRPPSVLP
ncbi:MULTISPECIES: hypothetical protein [Brucella]|uniref:Uncharacterized protein n=1 Tax=Brucella pecoris TaxID=867683 RepID=A0A5C5CVY7_9HYPH|nr:MULTISPECIES: hypothetical protein [Brucella]MBB4092345.1 hypothetical protein [Brucella pecoris]MCR8492926.1 hypothetical protein [Brucella anthropi]MDG9792101.1 hypothetical protein [Brucella anthropi]MDH0581142.1 hypothetical protein [Brucella anthropi]MDH0818040.1 hypothetical protein [Brucella anthropi]